VTGGKSCFVPKGVESVKQWRQRQDLNQPIETKTVLLETRVTRFLYLLLGGISIALMPLKCHNLSLRYAVQ